MISQIITSALNIDVDCYVYDTKKALCLLARLIILYAAFKVLASYRESEGNQKKIQDVFQARPKLNACLVLQMGMTMK